MSASSRSTTAPSDAATPQLRAWPDPHAPGAAVMRRVCSGRISGSRSGGADPSSTTTTSMRWAG